MPEQEKVNTLSAQFMRLDSSRKDYIRDLTRKLADIHRSRGFAGPAGIAPENQIQQKGDRGRRKE